MSRHVSKMGFVKLRREDRGALERPLGLAHAGNGMWTSLTCGMTQLNSPPPTLFTFQTTDSMTNRPIGTANTLVNIASGTNQTFVLSLRPTAPFCPLEIKFGYNCANAVLAPNFVGLNTLLLTASATPVPDVVALAATLNNDGIVNIPGLAGTGFFAVATTNAGAGGTIVVSADTGSATMPVALSICETNPATSACLAPPAPSLARVMNHNETPTFAIFVTGSGNVPFDPAGKRIFVRLDEIASCEGATNVTVTRGATSVAVRTQ